DRIKFTRANTLFLSLSANLNGNIAIDILSWFSKLKIYFGFLEDMDISQTASLLNEPNYRKLIHKLIKDADLGFENIEDEKVNLELKGLPIKLVKVLLKDQYRNKTKHRVFDKGKVSDSTYFDLKKEESLGTQKYVAMLGPILQALFNGEILVIDEMDARLHPQLSLVIAKLFNSNMNNPNNAQLIFATHTTKFMSSKVLRRDQKVIIEKDNQESTSIKTIYDKGVRNDASFEKDYLSGVYGGIPKTSTQLNLFE